MEFAEIARKEVAEAIHRLNSRLRAYLDCATSYEVFMAPAGLDAKMLVESICL